MMVVGCEDKLNSSDWDLNDIVFVIVGYPLIPDVIEYYHKRYLCEDLGNTYDFDFNDIVVDVDQISFMQAYLSEDKQSIVRRENLDKREQYATIKHLCGTLPFTVTVGDYTFPVVTDPTNESQTCQELSSDEPSGAPTRATNWNPEVTKAITGWNRTTNNISIKVADNPKNSILLTKKFGTQVIDEDTDKHIYTIDFPQDGEAPLIIAVDQTINWMSEYQHIPEKWWKQGKFTN